MPRANPRTSKTIGEQDKGSRAKAQAAHERTKDQVETADAPWPINAAGRPLVRIMMTAAELIPTGQYANVSVGPAQITAFVDPDASEMFSEDQRANLAKHLNDLAEIVEADVIAVQRNLVMESIQEQVAANGSK